MTPFFLRTHAAMASGPIESSTDFAVSRGGASAPPPDSDPGRSGTTGGVAAIPGGARPLWAERSPWMAWSARKTASLDGVVEGLAGLDLCSLRQKRGGGKKQEQKNNKMKKDEKKKGGETNPGRLLHIFIDFPSRFQILDSLLQAGRFIFL